MKPSSGFLPNRQPSLSPSSPNKRVLLSYIFYLLMQSYGHFKKGQAKGDGQNKSAQLR
jgi:hypothetical protein